MKALDEYIYQLEGNQKVLINYLDVILRQQYGLKGSIKWRIPFYERKGHLCYLNPIKNDGVEFVFYRGNKFSNEHGLLQSRGRKMVAGIVLYEIESLPESAVHEIIHEAILLDDFHGKKK